MAVEGHYNGTGAAVAVQEGASVTLGGSSFSEGFYIDTCVVKLYSRALQRY